MGEWDPWALPTAIDFVRYADMRNFVKRLYQILSAEINRTASKSEMAQESNCRTWLSTERQG